MPNRRQLISAAALAAGARLFGQPTSAADAAPAKPADPGKVYRIGVISSRIRGKPQRLNGHTWHFAQYFHPECNLDAIKKYKDPGTIKLFHDYLRNPAMTFGRWPFGNTVISHYYEPDPESAKIFCEAFPGVQIAESLEKMVQEVDAIWLGDASGFGEDHFDLCAPGLAKGLPTFCDKPIGGSVAETRKILEFARQHKAPIMSSSLFRHQWGTEEALRMKASGEFGPLQYVIASQAGGYTTDGWVIYGQHPVWMVMTLCGPGVEAVNLYAYENTCHALVTYKDRPPAEVWYGRPDVVGRYCSTAVHFSKKVYTYTPAIEDHYWLGHHYQMLNMADVFRKMVMTGVEPVPHQEILEVTAIVHAGVKSRDEKSRLVQLAEVMA
jgi:predicted dehydrogenase